ncbi:MAG: NtaA/DmoA family FMN-dependent monooxygenase [Chloroflexota bacterium]
MKKRIHLNAFALATPSPQFSGMWKHPEDRSAAGFTRFDYWIGLAKILERGCFDALFFAATMGVSDIFEGTERAMIQNGIFTPQIDPVLLVSALASHTTHLGYAVTVNSSHNAPYQTARLFSSLDHLTEGRIAWNVVTSTPLYAAQNGVCEVTEHDTRYDRADEYMEVCYKLWEKSWEDDAVVMDVKRDMFADPSKVHRINHQGEWFQVRGPHQVSPSPQRTPVIYQAGGSPRGTRFAGKHAEAVFLSQSSPERCASYVQQVRQEAASQGRDPNNVKVLMGFRCAVAKDQAAVAKLQAELNQYGTADGTLGMFSAWTGIDTGSIPRDTKVADLKGNAMLSVAKNATFISPHPDLTVGEVMDAIAENANGVKYIGTAEQIVDEMEALLETGIDGFNIVTSPHPGGYEAFVDYVVPVLQERGLFRKTYEESTLRERYLGKGQIRLPQGHPGTRL